MRSSSSRCCSLLITSSAQPSSPSSAASSSASTCEIAAAKESGTVDADSCEFVDTFVLATAGDNNIGTNSGQNKHAPAACTTAVIAAPPRPRMNTAAATAAPSTR